MARRRHGVHQRQQSRPSVNTDPQRIILDKRIVRIKFRQKQNTLPTMLVVKASFGEICICFNTLSTSWEVFGRTFDITAAPKW